MRKLPLVDGLKEYIGENVSLFSMPGHKSGRAFEAIKDILIQGDLTEVDGLDNLHKPVGIIKEAEDMLSNIYRSYRSYFLVNGSTCGNLIMIFSAFNEGDKILVERNCHRSIMNAIIMRKLTPIFIKNTIDARLQAPIGIDLEHLEDLLKKHNDLSGIILTYPNYYGLGFNMTKIISLCKKAKLKILIDSAHGAHLGFFDKSVPSAQELDADIVVMSAHKTLPSLTQTAWMHVNNKESVENVEFYKGIFMSTSPSYMFMMSLDYARSFLEYDAKEQYKYLIKEIENFKGKMKSVKYLTVMDETFFCKNKFNEVFMDSTRIVLNLKKGFSGNKLLDYLRKKNIQCEMSDYKNVVLIPTPFNYANDFIKLYEALITCDIKRIKQQEVNFYDCEIPNMKVLPFKVINESKILIDLDEAEGLIVSENIIPYPPGVPLLIMGELIKSNHINLIRNYINNNVTVIGIYNKKIKVLQL